MAGNGRLIVSKNRITGPVSYEGSDSYRIDFCLRGGSRAFLPWRMGRAGRLRLS